MAEVQVPDVRTIRGQLGLSQESFSWILDVSARSVERWEARGLTRLDAGTARRLAVTEEILALAAEVYEDDVAAFMATPRRSLHMRTQREAMTPGAAAPGDGTFVGRVRARMPGSAGLMRAGGAVRPRRRAMSRSSRSIRGGWPALVAVVALALAAAPTQAAGGTWAKILPIGNETQGLAAGPNGGAYVAVSPTVSFGTATLFSYASSGAKQWSTQLEAGGAQVVGLVSDPAGNAYVALAIGIADGEGYPYRVQQVKKNGTLGWDVTWHDADASLTGDASAFFGGRVHIAQRDTATGITTIRRFAATDGAPDTSWIIASGQGPAARPIDLTVTSAGAFLLDTSGKLVALKADGSFRWSKQVPGKIDRGVGMAVDATGISVEYEKGFLDLRLRRYTLAGVQKWDKDVPGSGTNQSAVAAAGGTTWAAGTFYPNDIVKAQIVIYRFDATGKLRAKTMVGTKQTDSGGFLLVSGTNLYAAGYVWVSGNAPLLVRLKAP